METKLESTLKSSLEIKEEKIAALEARLQESSNLNQQLRQELKTVSDCILKVFHADANREGLLFFFKHYIVNSPSHKAKTHQSPLEDSMCQNPFPALTRNTENTEGFRRSMHHLFILSSSSAAGFMYL